VSIENWVYNRKIDIAVASGTKQEGIKKKEEEKRAKYLLRCNQEGLEADDLKISVSKAECLLNGKSVLAMVMEQSKKIMNRITQ
jgi:hypothetical protein